MKILTENDIERIYKEHILKNKNEEYLNRYKKLPFQYNNKKWKWRGKGFPRIIALLEFNKLIKKYQPIINNLLTFNGKGDPELEYMDYKNHYDFHYSHDKKNYDLHTLNIPKNDYDFVLLNQTLEHLLNPFLCLSNIYNVLIKDAYIFMNNPSLGISHLAPHHFYTGFTPTGIACIVESCGFKILEVGQWGNREYIKTLYKTRKWPDYLALRSYVNEFDYPVINWVLGKKI